MPDPPIATPPSSTRARLDAVDLVRGAVMILMLLDHTRDFAHAGALVSDPLDPATSTPVLYATRWITHLCAPAFVLLAGLGVSLRGLRGTPAADLRHFLWTRGLWLVVLEIVVFRVLIWFNLDLSFLAQLQVIWAIGVSMIVLSVLIRLPVAAVVAAGAVIVLGHNALDGVQVPPWRGPGSAEPAALGKVWMLAHQGGFFPLIGFPSPVVWAHYPVLPWIGIMALGYGLGEVYRWPAASRRRFLLGLSAAMLCTFVVLRTFNVYGDPRPWVPHDTFTSSAMSFMNVAKYPPSLLFALVTLAPTLAALALLDGRAFRTGGAGAVVMFGRVPLFFYLLQWPTAHVAGIAITAVQGKDVAPYFMNVLDLFALRQPPDIGGPLWAAYLLWAGGVVLLYWPCRWFADVKATRRDWWLSYL